MLRSDKNIFIYVSKKVDKKKVLKVSGVIIREKVFWRVRSRVFGVRVVG